MRCRLRRFPLTKAVPLAISRGTTAAVEHLLVSLEHDGLTGIGETGGFETGHRYYDTDAVAAELEAVAPQLALLAPQPLRGSQTSARSSYKQPSRPCRMPARFP